MGKTFPCYKGGFFNPSYAFANFGNYLMFDRNRNNRFQQQRDTHRVNNGIRISPVMVIDKEGQNLGVMTADRARYLARQDDLDLVEVAPNARPPVCRIMDYSKFKYEQTIKEKEKKNNANKTQLKELRLSPVIGENDLGVKVKFAERWLEDGDKVLLKVKFKKRQMAHKDLGLVVVNKIIEVLKEVASPQSPPKFAGDSLTCILEPAKKV
jgi:translation initiation factor IF-3